MHILSDKSLLLKYKIIYWLKRW